MANVKISELPLTTAVTGADVVPIVQSGLTKQVSFSSVLTSPTLFASGMAAFLATPSSANLRAVLTDETGTGSAVFATSPTLVTPDIGTPSAGTLTNCTGLPASALTGVVPVANGGTNLTTFPALSIPVASTLNTLSALTAAASQSVRVNSGGTAWEAYTPGDVTLNGTQTLTNKTISGASNTLTVDGTNEVGFRIIPQNSQSAAYTAVLADSGKHILHPSADTTARTFTIPANSSVAYPVGTALTFINQNGAGTVTISINTDTMRLAGAGTTGNRTLAANGVATAIKITSTEWIISGTGLT